MIDFARHRRDIVTIIDHMLINNLRGGPDQPSERRLEIAEKLYRWRQSLIAQEAARVADQRPQLRLITLEQQSGQAI